MSATSPRHLVLVGLMGAGKSTVGRLVATRLARPFIDLDAEIVARAGATVAELFRSRGEEGFRDIEAQMLAAVLDRSEPHVVAAGGGALSRPESLARVVRQSDMVWLRVRPEVAAARCRSQGVGVRPLLDHVEPVDRLRALLQVREPAYSKAPLVLDTDDATPDVIAELLLSRLRLGMSAVEA